MAAIRPYPTLPDGQEVASNSTFPSCAQTNQLADSRSKVSSRSTHPTRPTSFRAHNHELEARNRRTRHHQPNAGLRARVLSLMPAGAQPENRPGG